MCPANSPDLNSIEHICDHAAQALCQSPNHSIQYSGRLGSIVAGGMDGNASTVGEQTHQHHKATLPGGDREEWWLHSLLNH